MRKWSGGALVAVLSLLLLRYTIFDLQSSPPVFPISRTINTTTMTTVATPLSPSSSFSLHPKPHLLRNLTGLSELYSPPSPFLAASRSTLLWPHMRNILSRSDALPDTGSGVKGAAVAWRELSSALAVEAGSAAKKSGRGREERMACPYSVTGHWNLRLPCGLVQDSAITIVGIPRRRNESGGGFVIQLLGSGEERERSVVLRYQVELGDGEIDGKGAFIAQNSWSEHGGWGKEEKCPSYNSTANASVDELVPCNRQVVRIKSKDNISNSSDETHDSVRNGGSPGSAHLSVSFPFTKEQPFAATLWVGVEGLHMSVNGRHETSFAYREKLEPWMVTEVKINGDLELLSSIANGLPVSEGLETIMGMETLRAPPVPKKRLFLFIGVFSTVNNFERRMALRRTWMQYEAVRSGYVAVRFFTGIHKNSQVNLEMWKEAQIYEDIQLMPFVDYYSLISLKTIGISIFGTKILPAKYIMKTDDDVFVRIDEVLSVLKRSSSNGILYGHISFKSEPYRDKESKWYISPEEWRDDFYPPWAHGPGYIISRDVAKFVVQGHQERNLQMFKLEDVAMGIWIEKFQKSGHELHYINDDRFHSFNCENGYILAHYQGPRLILCLWEKLQKENEPICCE